MGNILLVDDNELAKVSMERMLSKAGYNVVAISDSREAMGLISRFNFDLVVTDLLMPFMSGLDLIRSVKNFAPQKKVIVFSLKNDEKTKMDCYQAGAEDFVDKPIPLAELVMRVRRLIG